MEAIWEGVKEQIKSELSQSSFSLWIKPLTFSEQKDGTIVLACPNKFSKKWVTENYADLIQTKLRSAVGTDCAIGFKVAPLKRKILPPP
ncbi:MAG: hypothetical protein JRI80_19375, partial [Deltaproteobacteria bacterium]|nr:hypothetical protein [Deltaproteobacteria bacterium]